MCQCFGPICLLAGLLIAEETSLGSHTVACANVSRKSFSSRNNMPRVIQRLLFKRVLSVRDFYVSITHSHDLFIWIRHLARHISYTQLKRPLESHFGEILRLTREISSFGGFCQNISRYFEVSLGSLNFDTLQMRRSEFAWTSLAVIYSLV